MKKLKNIPKYFLYFSFLVVAVPLFAFFLIWGLAFLLWLTQLVLIEFGYTFKVADNIKTAIVTFCGAVCVAAFALYGVRAQNLSAESRHRMDNGRGFSVQYNITFVVMKWIMPLIG